MSVDKLGTGLISGQVAVATKPAEGGSVVSTPVRFTYDLDYPKDVKRFLALLLAIVAIGVAIPVLLLYLVKWRGAKIPGPTLSVGSVRGKVDETQSFLSSTSMRPQDLRVVPLEGTGRRRVGISPRAELVTRMGLGLTEPGYATVDGVTAVTSSGSASTGRRPARLPLNVQDHWVAILDAADPHAGEVEVVFITDPSAAKLGELLNDARNQMPEYVTRLRRTLPEAAAPTPGQQQDDWSSPSSASSRSADDPWGSSSAQPPSSTGSPGGSGSADDW
jgi:hypothetical protein